MTESYLNVTMIFIIITALIAVETRDMLGSIICLGVIGLGLSIAFLLLQTPDLTIVQIPVEVMLFIYLIRSTIGRDIELPDRRSHWLHVSSVLVILVLIFLFGCLAFKSFDFGNPVINSIKGAPSNAYLENSVKQTGASNVVTAIILDYRSYDTLGEVSVLFAAVLGAVTILRERSRTEDGGKTKRSKSRREKRT